MVAYNNIKKKIINMKKNSIKFVSSGLLNTGFSFGSAYSAFSLSNLSKVCKRFFSLRNFALGNPDKKLASWWVTGITDAEGCFSIFEQKTSMGIKIILGFKVTQKAHSMGILYDLERYFNCGRIHIDSRKDDAYKFNVNKLEDILNIIIPHFDKYPLLTSKRLDYLDFKRVALMMKDGLHLKKEGQEIIHAIKVNMNNGRSLEERWNFFDTIEPIVLVNE